MLDRLLPILLEDPCRWAAPAVVVMIIQAVVVTVLEAMVMLREG